MRAIALPLAPHTVRRLEKSQGNLSGCGARIGLAHRRLRRRCLCGRGGCCEVERAIEGRGGRGSLSLRTFLSYNSIQLR